MASDVTTTVEHSTFGSMITAEFTAKELEELLNDLFDYAGTKLGSTAVRIRGEPGYNIKPLFIGGHPRLLTPDPSEAFWFPDLASAAEFIEWHGEVLFDDFESVVLDIIDLRGGQK